METAGGGGGGGVFRPCILVVFVAEKDLSLSLSLSLSLVFSEVSIDVYILSIITGGRCLTEDSWLQYFASANCKFPLTNIFFQLKMWTLLLNKWETLFFSDKINFKETKSTMQQQNQLRCDFNFAAE